jgi:hypothetical protein
MRDRGRIEANPRVVSTRERQRRPGGPCLPVPGGPAMKIEALLSVESPDIAASKKDKISCFSSSRPMRADLFSYASLDASVSANFLITRLKASFQDAEIECVLPKAIVGPVERMRSNAFFNAASFPK